MCTGYMGMHEIVLKEEIRDTGLCVWDTWGMGMHEIVLKGKIRDTGLCVWDTWGCMKLY